MHKRKAIAVGGFLFALISVSRAQGNAHLNSGAWAWREAAKTDRAGVLFLGDSIVNHGQGGWTAGLAAAAQGSIGLAGSSLLTAPAEAPATWSYYAGARLWTNSSTESTSTGVPSLSPFGRYLEPTADLAFLGSGADAVKLDLSGRVDWHVLATATSAQAAIGAHRVNRIGSSAIPVQTIPSQPLSGLSETVFRFDTAVPAGDWQTFNFTPDTRDAALHYTRLTLPDKTGISVTGWGFSGGTCDSFRSQFYNDPQFTPDGRDALYRSLVAGDSGKLNVVITFGVNDARTYSPQGYGTAIRGLIDDVRRDWAHAGLDPLDLSFTLPSAYQVNSASISSQAWYRLIEYRGVLDAIAAADPQVSFVDVWEDGPTWQTAVASGYLEDGIHPSTLGTAVYGELLMRLLDPQLGDADVDGHVDFEDMLLLVQHYGQSSNSLWTDGDFDANGIVNFSDVLLLIQNYTTPDENRSPQIEFELARSLVPEPSLAIVLSCLSTLRRSRH